ncbi:hypothetical protein BLOT_011818, partial [Blomia tropicalis]
RIVWQNNEDEKAFMKKYRKNLVPFCFVNQQNSYIGMIIFELFIFIIIYFSFTVDENYSLNILNPRIKFYNIELRQHRLIFITRSSRTIELILILVWTLLLNGRILSKVASTVTRSNSIKRMINGFVGKFEIDDGIYDSKDFRLVFNSIAATCKATENCFGLDNLKWQLLQIKFNLSLVFYYEILKLELLDANLERYSEIQFQSCLSLHRPNCCDQFPCPSFNYSNHTYFFLVNQFHTRLLFTSYSVRKIHCIQGIFRQFEMAIAPGYCDV